MKIAREEIFVPVAPLFRFHGDAEPSLSPTTPSPDWLRVFYGRDICRVWRVAEGLEYGMVGVNTGLIPTQGAPFGGVKEPGLGLEGSHHGIDHYFDLKYIRMWI